MDRGGFLQRLRTAGLSLALFALVFKAMLPPGYMLSADAGDRIVMTLCGGGEAVLDLSGFSDHDPGHGKAAAECPFAFTSAPVLSPPDVSAPAPVHAARVSTQEIWRDTDLTLTLSGPPLPARGPPLQA